MTCAKLAISPFGVARHHAGGRHQPVEPVEPGEERRHARIVGDVEHLGLAARRLDLCLGQAGDDHPPAIRPQQLGGCPADAAGASRHDRGPGHGGLPWLQAGFALELFMMHPQSRCRYAAHPPGLSEMLTCTHSIW